MRRQGGKQRQRVDWMLLAIVASLLSFGVISVYSASYADAQRHTGNSAYYFSRQMIWATLGLGTMTAAAIVDYRIWKRYSIPIMAVALLGLLAVLMLSEERFGAQRNLFSGSVQPSEFAKIAVIIYLAAWLSSREKTLRDARLGLVPFAILLGIVTMLIVAEPNFSTAILIVVTAITMFFIAGADLKQLGVALAALVITFTVLISQSDYAQARVRDYIQFLRDPAQGGSEQARQAVRLLVQGGLAGRGGPGAAQLDPSAYIPIGWSDAILAIVGRDTGLLGTLLVVGLFAGLLYRGFRIALHAHDRFGMLLASGITFWLVFQAIINIGVITAMIPFTGMPLPFISYGGSSLVTAMTGIGLLLSVSRGGSPARQTEEASAGLVFRRGHRRSRVSILSDRASPVGRAPLRRRSRRPRR
ncbi:MAG: FtsW/RodA/SpoVE family cell cycle protein [Anaerolineae bacterium]|nr:FtsW/RodA/SpoVE family cell cycle protein [Anaerolineae bacterium]MDW8100965.1 FtsW/RodA/SpoVE family cell cycle protein [Anaerolineae bacterium]